MENSGEAIQQHRIQDERFNSGVKGVWFDIKGRKWIASVSTNQNKYSTSFSCDKYGFEHAKQLAILTRKIAKETATIPCREGIIERYSSDNPEFQPRRSFEERSEAIRHRVQSIIERYELQTKTKPEDLNELEHKESVI
jgi:hypothetical protein